MGVLYAFEGLCWCVEFQNPFESSVLMHTYKADRLWIADPKALHQILQATSYLYVKPSIRKETASLLTDRGLVWADGVAVSPISSRVRLTHLTGDTHRRQRKSMMPAFGLTTSREYLPRLIEVLDKVRSSSGHPFRDDVSGVARWNVERSRLKRIRGGAGDNRRT